MSTISKTKHLSDFPGIFYLSPFQSNYLTVSYVQKVLLLAIVFFTKFSYVFTTNIHFRFEEVFGSNTLMITLNLYFCPVLCPML